MNWRLFALPVCIGLSACGFSQVDVHSMLQEMTNLSRLSERPSLAYNMALASSYDRTSTTPTNPATWFDNNDHGQFIRTETHSGRTEYVMADLKGPGAVVRIWSANPIGSTLRFYFDGETTPRLSGTMDSLLNGSTFPFIDPFGYVAAEGYDLYFPLPYAKSLKITTSGTSSIEKALYYQVGYRTYVPGTTVTTYVPGSVSPAELSTVSSVLLNPSMRFMPRARAMAQTTGVVTTTTAAELMLNGPGAVYELNVKVDPPTVKNPSSWTDSGQMWNVLRNLLLEVSFDGEQCIQAPLGDFFGTAPGVHAYDGYPFSVASDGTMTCRFVMPYGSMADFKIVNLGSAKPNVTMTATTGPYAFDSGSYYFHAQWTVQRQPSRPLRDINLLTAQGEGLWVGDNLHIANVSSDWWGEGDDKVYVNNESFPSSFGTGSEDYFGYAWCSPSLFERPYHGQPNNDYPANYGNTDVHRWNVLDPIPYTSALSFNIEAYSVNTNTTPTFAHTSYWYALPGAQPLRPVDTTLLLPPQVGMPKSLQGTMVQGEDLPLVSVSGGALSVQIHQTSALGYKQLMWHGGQPGDQFISTVNIPVAGTYKYTIRPHFATSGGTFRAIVNGQDMGGFDLYRTSSGLTQTTVGTITLPAGPVNIEFDLTQRNALSTDNDVALDWILFQKQ